MHPPPRHHNPPTAHFINRRPRKRLRSRGRQAFLRLVLATLRSAALDVMDLNIQPLSLHLRFQAVAPSGDIRLGCRVDGQIGHPDRRCGARIDDQARLMLRQDGQERGSEQGREAHIGLHELRNLGRRVVRKGREILLQKPFRAANVVHQNRQVQIARRALHEFPNRLLRLPRHIRDKDEELAVRVFLLQLRLASWQLCGVTTVEDDVEAAPAELLREGEADAVAGAGDERPGRIGAMVVAREGWGAEVEEDEAVEAV